MDWENLEWDLLFRMCRINFLASRKMIRTFSLADGMLVLEGDLKFTFFHYVFLEYGNKLDYARYSGSEDIPGNSQAGVWNL